jgi:hypothetical protein
LYFVQPLRFPFPASQSETFYYHLLDVHNGRFDTELGDCEGLIDPGQGW